MNSDAFKAQLGGMQEYADVAVLNDIPAKLRGVASLALDGLAEQLSNALADGSVRQRPFLQESANLALHRLGYAPQKQVPQTGGHITQNNTFVSVSQDALASARANFTLLGGAVHVEEATSDSPPVQDILPT
jgi:hypothetical protein